MRSKTGVVKLLYSCCQKVPRVVEIFTKTDVLGIGGLVLKLPLEVISSV